MDITDVGVEGFGALLKGFRLAAGLSQETLAEQARPSPEAISALERAIAEALTPPAGNVQPIG